jgi:hypothetical protein
MEEHRTGLASVTKEEVAEVIYEEATRHNYDPKFVLALIATESEFYNWAVSEKGAKGLMQIMPYVAESLAQELGIEYSGDRIVIQKAAQPECRRPRAYTTFQKADTFERARTDSSGDPEFFRQR